MTLFWVLKDSPPGKPLEYPLNGDKFNLILVDFRDTYDSEEPKGVLDARFKVNILKHGMSGNIRKNIPYGNEFKLTIHRTIPLC